MADNNSSEEKKHPASEKKLRKQREKGSVVQSRETLLSVATTVGLIYLLFSVKRGVEIGLILFQMEDYYQGADFGHKVNLQLVLIGELITIFVLPLMVAVSVMGVAVSVLVSGGFVFTTERMKPDFTKFNPASGLKNIFGIKSMKTFVMHMLRLALIGTLVIYTVYYFTPSIIASSNCGYNCGVSVNATVYFYVFLILIIASIIFAAFDFIVQRMEFLRENKMTETEQKQERKEQYGSPEIRQRLREIRQDIATKLTGLKYTNFILADSLNRAIAIHYERGGSNPPIVVAKARGREAVMRMMALSGKPAEDAPELISLIRKIGVGDPITDEAAIKALVPFLEKYT